MGDHRASIKCSIKMHGHEAEQEWWINQDPTGCDQRIVDWFDAQVAAAMAIYEAEMAEYYAKRDSEAREAQERAELERLKQKYEQKE